MGDDKHSGETPPYKYYFNDNERRIDFVLVCYKEIFETVQERACLETFISNLEEKGIHCELDFGIYFDNLAFIKIHGPKDLLERYAAAYKIPLMCYAIDSNIRPKRAPFKCMDTVLTKPDITNPIFGRAQKAIVGGRPLRITFIERVIVLNELLSRTSFGTKPSHYGLSKLLEKNIFIAVYPLHVGPWIWNKTGPLNDRQLLAGYWANIKMCTKQQPLDLVYRYLGPEIAVYFAFCGFYNKMLIIPSIVGFLSFLYGLIKVTCFKSHEVEDMCTDAFASETMICPGYLNDNGKPLPLRLEKLCTDGKITLIFDNDTILFFCLFISIWATLFVELWKRKYALLLLRWNLMADISEEQLRREYGVVCPVTGNTRPYASKRRSMCYLALTYLICALMLIFVLIIVFSTILIQLALKNRIWNKNAEADTSGGTWLFTSIALGAFITVICIYIVSKFYNKISMWLTIKENPRTQAEFDDSYTYKRFLLSVINNYTAVSYIAFVKGRLYTFPSDSSMKGLVGLKADLCYPAGCVGNLCILLAFIMLFKPILGNLLNALISYVKYVCFNKINMYDTIESLPQWELDYNLNETGRYFLISDYSEMIIQYGFVAFFSAAFPLAPLCALMNNIIELRTDAIKYVKHYRRPIPIRISNMKAWHGILEAMTLASILVNGLIIALTSNFMDRLVYKIYDDTSLKGYFNTTLLRYENYCYYPGHVMEDKTIVNIYWKRMFYRFAAALILEYIALTITGILAYAIPDIPEEVKTRLRFQRNKMKEQHVNEMPTAERATYVFGNENL